MTSSTPIGSVWLVNSLGGSMAIWLAWLDGPALREEEKTEDNPSLPPGGSIGEINGEWLRYRPYPGFALIIPLMLLSRATTFRSFPRKVYNSFFRSFFSRQLDFYNTEPISLYKRK